LARTSTKPRAVELCWSLVGERRGRVWHGRRCGRSVGEPASVEFDGDRVLRREEQRRDVIGFLHTHPGMPAIPSGRDLRTMRAWCSCFGKPLLCVIAGADAVRAYRFDNDTGDGIELPTVELFAGGVVVGVEEEGDNNGRHVSP
jgi:proteasome lid subunit RPN8/RPN11